jgi:hypothetical protein
LPSEKFTAIADDEVQFETVKPTQSRFAAPGDTRKLAMLRNSQVFTNRQFRRIDKGNAGAGATSGLQIRRKRNERVMLEPGRIGCNRPDSETRLSNTDKHIPGEIALGYESRTCETARESSSLPRATNLSLDYVFYSFDQANADSKAAQRTVKTRQFQRTAVNYSSSENSFWFIQFWSTKFYQKFVFAHFLSQTDVIKNFEY